MQTRTMATSRAIRKKSIGALRDRIKSVSVPFSMNSNTADDKQMVRSYPMTAHTLLPSTAFAQNTYRDSIEGG